METNEIPEIRRNHKPKSFELGKAKKESSKEEEFKPPKESKKSTISTNTNKGYNHTLMMNAIGAYARTHEIQLRKENSHADLTSFNEEEQTFKIIEIKSYPALYLAIGQLLHYEHKFKKVIHTAENLEYKKIYVGVETLDSIQEGLLEQLNIKYVKYDKQKLDEIFN
ncbi:hypothetical protein C4B25_00325 [Mycoplasma todarodis]|uniref:Uncharacterized protein n=1 Tax=Mycoplasma todarodis TaxID=1937191 RepID=A0A4V2NID2_9MOLU|nr:hypothetical protein C4B25_00325 [Mycoplasma todarodis]